MCQGIEEILEDNVAMQKIIKLLMLEIEANDIGIPGEVVGLALKHDIELFEDEEE
jgi:hypothetical protein